jgi:hypothetical protein
MQSKVKVKVESFKGWLRLRWSCAGERYSLALGLPDSKVNRTVAAGKAAVIEGDLATENLARRWRSIALKDYSPTPARPAGSQSRTMATR